MKTRICEKCHEEKSLEVFYRNKSRPEGRGYWCKDCCKVHERLPHRKGRHAKWRNSPKGKAKTREYNKAHYEEDKPKQRARATIHRLIELGIIKRMPCETCGETNSQGHHPDYSKPLEVRWLCQSHHYDADRR